MRYDSIIIGGGLAGLVCGVRLQRSGKRCAIVSSGQNAMHFSSGSFGLLYNNEDGTPVTEPLKAVASLGAEHPYSKIGAEKVGEYAGQLKEFFDSCGIALTGNPEKNSYMVSPVGVVKPAWLALEDVTLLESAEEKIGDKVMVANLKGYLDFNTDMIAAGLEKMGSQCRIVDIDHASLDSLRINPSEMRSVNIARVVDQPEVRKAIVAAVQSRLEGEDTVVLPAVFGLWSAESMHEVKKSLGTKVVLIGTMPPSVPGIRSQMLLKKAFEDAGGTFLLGDEVTEVKLAEGSVEYIRTENLGDTRLEASNYVLATGSYFSKGLWATPSEIVEPLAGLEVIYPASRSEWYDKNFYAKQNYLGCGVRTDEAFHPVKDGGIVTNMYAIGSVLGGHNPLELGCGAGVAILSAMAVSDKIMEE